MKKACGKRTTGYTTVPKLKTKDYSVIFLGNPLEAICVPAFFQSIVFQVVLSSQGAKAAERVYVYMFVCSD
jgi:hypothetical protein